MPLNSTQDREKYNQATLERYAPHFNSDRSTCQKEGIPNRIPQYYLNMEAQDKINQQYKNLMD